FQAEDGIRDRNVTGVQTCALPISERRGRPWHMATASGAIAHHVFEVGAGVGVVFQPWLGLGGATALWATLMPTWLASTRVRWRRSEERRVGKECRAGGTRQDEHEK